jgi:hypothetical protein
MKKTRKGQWNVARRIAAAKSIGRQPNSESTIRVFRAMAEPVEAGEPWRDVLADYGLDPRTRADDPAPRGDG